MDSTTDVSSPSYFMTTFNVGEAQAAELSRQAGLVSQTRGGGVTAEAPRALPSSPSAVPGQPALSAQAEYDSLLADRASGKITSAQWKSTGGGAERERALAEIIANGGAAQPAPAAQAPAAETHPYLGAPASANDYGLLHGAGDLPAERVAEITAQQESFARLNLSKGVVQDVNARLRTATAQLEHATPAQVKATIDANCTRFNAMCAKDGMTPDQATALIGAQFGEWSRKEPGIAPLLQSIATIQDPIVLDYVLQIAKHNRAARR